MKIRLWLAGLAMLAGCAGGPPPPGAANVREGKGWCPICRMWHDEGEMGWPATWQGKNYRFCDPNCRAAFTQNPEKYLSDRTFNP